MYQVTYQDVATHGSVEGTGPTLRDAIKQAALTLQDTPDLEEVHTLLLYREFAHVRGGLFAVSPLTDLPDFRVCAELTGARTFRRTYEVARWFTDIRCEPQSVVSESFRDSDGKRRQRIEFAGSITDQDLTSLFGGVPIVGEVERPDVGRKDAYRLSLADDQLMRLFTGGGEHEPRTFDHEEHRGLRLHYLSVAWDLEAVSSDSMNDTWLAVRTIGDDKQVFGRVQHLFGGGFQAVIEAQEWAGPARGSRSRALRDIIRRTR